MMFRKAFAAAAAAALIATPTMAAAADAGAAAREVSPAQETIDANGQQQIYGASVLLQLGILVVAGVLIWLAVDQLGGNNKPASP